VENNISVFERLNAVDVQDQLDEKKSGNTDLLYLKWAYAWSETKKVFPEATYRILRFGENNLPYVYDPNTGYMVFTEVTIEGLTHSMWLCVLDGANKAMKAEPYEYTVGSGDKKRTKIAEAATMYDINRTLMRCLVKNLAMHGLGLSIYYGEVISPEAKQKAEEEEAARKKQQEILTAERNKIISLATEKTESGIDKDTIYSVIQKYTGGKKNPNAIQTIEDAKACFKEIEAMKP